MNTEQILMCVVALILGMLLANMLKSVCGCKNLIEGQSCMTDTDCDARPCPPGSNYRKCLLGHCICQPTRG